VKLQSDIRWLGYSFPGSVATKYHPKLLQYVEIDHVACGRCTPETQERPKPFGSFARDLKVRLHRGEVLNVALGSTDQVSPSPFQAGGENKNWSQPLLRLLSSVLTEELLIFWASAAYESALESSFFDLIKWKERAQGVARP